MMMPDTGGVGIHAIGLVTQARPALAGSSMRETYLTQPMLVLDDPGPRFSGRLMLNFEAWTLKEGELNAGISGEGFVDRRHPHTFLHEIVVTTHGRLGPLGWSLTGGRGFVPFGSDDPMARPFVKYPANHHLAQVMERWVGVAATTVGRVALEAAIFNGDEPTGPRSRGRRDRIGDSYGGRISYWPSNELELQASHARVASPEHADGGGLDHRKWHASGRFVIGVGGLPLYGLVEWGRTYEEDDGRTAFTFETALAEASLDIGASRVAARWERTTRPEEERLLDPFRSARPHADENIIGVTRWRTMTLSVAHELSSDEIVAAPFLEVSRLYVRELTGAIFEPPVFYGDDRHWSLSAGLRLGIGIRHARAGRYGVALRGGHAGM
jgi:hypothetical protein